MLNQKSINLIHSFEGCRLACYHLGDGVCTIGYGHTRPLNQCGGAGSWRITQAQADQFFNIDIQKYENAVTGYFTRHLNENQKGALTSFCYNLGTGIFAKYNFPRNGSDINITNQMMLFCNKGTQFEAGITRRRKAEVALFLDGSVQAAQTTQTISIKGDFEDMKLVQLTTDGDYYGKKYKAGACFITTGDSIRYIERPQTLTTLDKLGVQRVSLSAIDFLLFIQDLNLKII